MEILHRGELPEARRVEGTCSNCGTKVRFAVIEAKVTENQRDGRWAEVECPVCQRPICSQL